jgi:hypothetical protein
MTVGKGKRPRDPNQLAARTVAVSAGQIPAPEPEVTEVTASASPANISEFMAACGKRNWPTTCVKKERKLHAA